MQFLIQPKKDERGWQQWNSGACNITGCPELATIALPNQSHRIMTDYRKFWSTYAVKEGLDCNLLHQHSLEMAQQAYVRGTEERHQQQSDTLQSAAGVTFPSYNVRFENLEETQTKSNDYMKTIVEQKKAASVLAHSSL